MIQGKNYYQEECSEGLVRFLKDIQCPSLLKADFARNLSRRLNKFM